MSSRADGFPRFFTIAGRFVNSYTVFLAVGICVGALVTAAMADASGLSPLRAGSAAMVSGLAGLIGARLYHLVLHRATGGLSLFGSLLTFVPVSFAAAALAGIPAAVLFDEMAVGVLAGGLLIRLGCVFNGCCVGRETAGRFGVRLHDAGGVTKRRIPAQFLEMFWWLLGLALVVSLWPTESPPGCLFLAVLAWYSAARFFLEPLRELPELINQVVAALLVAAGAGGLIALLRS